MRMILQYLKKLWELRKIVVEETICDALDRCEPIIVRYIRKNLGPEDTAKAIVEGLKLYIKTHI